MSRSNISSVVSSNAAAWASPPLLTRKSAVSRSHVSRSAATTASRKAGKVSVRPTSSGSATAVPPFFSIIRTVSSGAVGAAVVSEDHADPPCGDPDGCASPDARASAGDDRDLHGEPPVHSWSPRTSARTGLLHQSAATTTNDIPMLPFTCLILLLPRVSSGWFNRPRAPRGAANAARPPRPARHDHRRRRRPGLEGRPAGPAVAIDDRHGAGAHRAGGETPRTGRPRVRVRRRAVPGRVGRPARHRALRRRDPRAPGAGLRPGAAPVRRRRTAAAGGSRRPPARGRRRATGHRRQRRPRRAGRRGGPPAAAARPTPRRHGARAADRAGDPLAAPHRRAGRRRPPARPRRQQPLPHRPGGAVDPRPLRTAVPRRGRGAGRPA